MAQQDPIDFNKPYLSGNELEYIRNAIKLRHLSGNGDYTKKCQAFFERRYGLRKCLLTSSCTDALEMCAILLDIQPGDEVIVPSYTFVSTANAFVLRGAKIVFVDNLSDHPNLDPALIEPLITLKTKAIVVVHYAGMACDMGRIMALANDYKLFVVEDAAQAIDSFYLDKEGAKRPLGSIGHLAAFSFHETKNIISGEGGMLIINHQRFEKRAEIIWEKGTNRAAFFKGEVDKYGWVDLGSSFLPSEIIAAFLFAQLENLENIQTKRKAIWDFYYEGLRELEVNRNIMLPSIPTYATNNAHMFYVICKNGLTRDAMIRHLRKKGIYAVFHYLSLHQSPYYKNIHGQRALPWSDYYSECLIRLPFYFEMTTENQTRIIDEVKNFFIFTQ